VSARVPVDALQRRLQRRARPETRAWWENYVKDGAPFRGTAMEDIRTELRGWLDVVGPASLPSAGWVDVALDLLHHRHAEDKLAGVLLLAETLAPLGVLQPRRDLPRFAAALDDGALADWNVVDWFCVKVLGPRLAADPDGWADGVAAWRSAPGVWRARASLVPFTVVAHDPRHADRIARGCAALIARPERFAKTAVGWVLREVSRQDPLRARALAEAHLADFSAEALRNALKHQPEAVRERLQARGRRLRAEA